VVMSSPLSLLLQQVDEGKNQNPDQIDEVPIQAGDLDMLRDVTATRDRGQNTGIVNNTSGHMHAVKTGQDKERCREQVIGKRDPQLRQALTEQMRPFVRLAA
jgi:hypothetical protein